MWIHQRTSENTAVSYPGWVLLVGVLVVLSVLKVALPYLVGAAVLWLLWWGLNRYDEHASRVRRGKSNPLADRFRSRFGR